MNAVSMGLYEYLLSSLIYNNIVLQLLQCRFPPEI